MPGFRPERPAVGSDRSPERLQTAAQAPFHLKGYRNEAGSHLISDYVLDPLHGSRLALR